MRPGKKQLSPKINKNPVFNAADRLIANQTNISSILQMKNSGNFTQEVLIYLQQTIGNQAVCQLLRDNGLIKDKNNTGPNSSDPAKLKKNMENISGIDLSDVKINLNSLKPKELGALAFTKGNEIHVAPGQEKHLPHELWHAVQQKQGRVRPTGNIKGNKINTSENLEHEADMMGIRAVGNIPLASRPLQSAKSSKILQRKMEKSQLLVWFRKNKKSGNFLKYFEKDAKNTPSDADQLLKFIEQKLNKNLDQIDEEYLNIEFLSGKTYEPPKPREKKKVEHRHKTKYDVPEEQNALDYTPKPGSAKKYKPTGYAGKSKPFGKMKVDFTDENPESANVTITFTPEKGVLLKDTIVGFLQIVNSPKVEYEAKKRRDVMKEKHGNDETKAFTVDRQGTCYHESPYFGILNPGIIKEKSTKLILGNELYPAIMTDNPNFSGKGKWNPSFETAAIIISCSDKDLVGSILAVAKWNLLVDRTDADGDYPDAIGESEELKTNMPSDSFIEAVQIWNEQEYEEKDMNPNATSGQKNAQKRELVDLKVLERSDEKEPPAMMKKKTPGRSDDDLQTPSIKDVSLLKKNMEFMSGIDLGGVKINYNSAEPKELGALAFTKGNEIHVAPGQEKHLPHELWHAVQQKQGRVRPTGNIKGVHVNSNRDLENEADLMGARALKEKNNSIIYRSHKNQASGITANIIQRKEVPDFETEILTEHEPLRILEKYNKNWFTAKKHLTTKEFVSKEKDDSADRERVMQTLITFRRSKFEEVKNYITAKMVEKIKSDLHIGVAVVTLNATGSSELTSDIDVTCLAPGHEEYEVQIVKEFNKKFLDEFKVPSGAMFDINAYTSDYQSDAAGKAGASKEGGDKNPKEDLAKYSGSDKIKKTSLEKINVTQTALGLVSIREFLDKKDAWNSFCREIRNEVRQKARALHQDENFMIAKLNQIFEKTESIYADTKTKVDASVARLTTENGGKRPEEKMDELQIKALAKDQLYEEQLGIVSNLLIQRKELIEKIKPIISSETAKDVSDLAGFQEQLRSNMEAMDEAQGKACIYANEAYYNAGAVLNMLGSDAVKAKLTVQDLIGSILMNVGYKLQHFNEKSKDAIENAKYDTGKYGKRIEEVLEKLKILDEQSVLIKNMLKMDRSIIDDAKKNSAIVTVDKKKEKAAEIGKKLTPARINEGFLKIAKNGIIQLFIGDPDRIPT